VAARAQGTSMGNPVDAHYTSASGTSMATPVCAGLIVLLLQAARKAGLELTPDRVKAILKEGATALSATPPATQAAGFVEMQALLARLGQPAGGLGESVLEVVRFATTDGLPHPAGERRSWTLAVHNAGPRPLYDVAATFAVGELAFETPRATV